MDHDLSEWADDIWHRALIDAPASLLVGDRAIWAVLLFHGYAMNGGVLHAVECLDEAELTAAVEGYEWLGLGDVALMVTEIRQNGAGTGRLSEEAVDDRYDQSVPDDTALFDTLERRVAAAPEAFAPPYEGELEAPGFWHRAAAWVRRHTTRGQ